MTVFVTSSQIGCHKTAVDTADWSKPEVVAKTHDSLDTSFSVAPFNESFVATGGEDGTFAVRFPSDSETHWKSLPVSDDGWLPMDCDLASSRVVVTKGVAMVDRIEMSFLIAHLNSEDGFQGRVTNRVTFNRLQFFHTKNPNIRFPTSRVPYAQPFAGGVIAGPEIYVPFSIEAEVQSGKAISFGNGPAVSGVFATRNSGGTWECETVAAEDWFIPSVHKTQAQLYFLGGDTKLQRLKFSRKAGGTDAWDAPQTIENAQCPSGVNLYYQAVAADECVHLVWLDRRHEKKRLSLVHPNRGNYEVAYCHRRDSDSGWSKEVILSEGLLYAYEPSISVDGDKIVVAWAGVQNDKDGRNEFDPCDIYYATSNDGGKSWHKPKQVTDGFKAGLTSGRPQVALHKGVIHLFYIQGKLDFKKVSTGMVKLNQPPWPIFYQQRPFPSSSP